MAIQFLRGSGTSSTVLADGQPYYDKTSNLLYIGNGSTALSSLTALNKPYWMQYYYIYKAEFNTSNTANPGSAYLYIGFRIDEVLTHANWHAGSATDATSIWYALYSRGYSSYPVEYCVGSLTSISSSYTFDVMYLKVSSTTAASVIGYTSKTSTAVGSANASYTLTASWTCTMQQAIKLINN